VAKEVKMDRQQIMQLASQNPQVQQAVEMAKQQVAHMDLNPQLIDEVIQVLEHVMDSPNDYPAIRAAAIRDGFVEEGDLPPEFDPIVIASLLIVFYGLKDQSGQQQQEQAAFARGGLAHLAAQGRGGDTMLAHINPQEAEMLRRMGGSGGINPNTGLHEFKGGGLMKIVKTVAPIALAVAAPGLGTVMSAALGAGVGALGGGGLKGALTGAALGGLGAGLGGTVGGLASEAAGAGLGTAGQNILGSTLIGGGLGAVNGQGFKQGALQGLAGGVAGNAISGLAGAENSAVNSGLRSGGSTAGNLMTAGADAKTALKGGALAGLISGGIQGYNNAKPSAVVTDSLGLKSAGQIEGIKAPSDVYTMTEPSATPSSGLGVNPSSTSMTANDMYTPPQTLAQQTGADTTNIGMNKATLGGGLALAGLAGAAAAQTPPPEAQKAIESMSPTQKEYFNRPSYVWDWDKMSSDAAAQGMDLGTFMAKNWNNVSGGQYNKQVGTEQTEVAKARGGALNALAQGGGSGRADTIHAKLSDGEYVVDAETVALLGDGSTKEGAKRLDEMRKKLRMQKGKTLAKGGFSPAAKSPLAYLKGAA
jgi:hypothetical protein